MRVFLVSGLYNGIKGTLIGLLGGWLLASQLNNLLQLLGVQLVAGLEGQGLPVELQWPQVWLMVGLSLILCLLATLYPAYRAMQLQPAAALRDD